MKAIPVLLLAAAAALAAVAAELSPDEARERIAALRRELAGHDEHYHREDAPATSDEAYDRLKRQLAALERTFPEAARATPPLAEIGDDRSGLFRTYRHRVRMMSLEKAYAESELRLFCARLEKATGRADLAYVVEPKYDGLAVSVTYDDGVLVRAVTRGNGSDGDDITANALEIRSLPRRLAAVPGSPWPRTVELRGEIHVPIVEFERVNAERELAGEPRFANPRNLASGTIRQLDPGEVSRRGLQVVFFGIGGCEPASTAPESQQGLHARLRAWGLPAIPQTWPAHGPDEIVRAVRAVQRARRDLPFPIDGAVVKLDAVALQREIGASETAPRWAIAYKFAPERAVTQLRAITLQVGRTGVLTPVAELAPVRLAGSTIARATLHNAGEIARKDIRVGDFVFVEKAGDIIPAITGVDLAQRPPTAQPYVFPDTCPACHGVVSIGDEAAARCLNAACPAQLRRRLEHYVSKGCVDIEGLGPAMIEALVAHGWVKDLPDLYRLRREDLLTLGRTSAKSVDRLLAGIERSKRAELWRVIHGIGLPHVGPAMAKDLARQCGTLRGVAEQGAKVASAAGEPRYQALIADLIAVGVAAEPAVKPVGRSTPGNTLPSGETVTASDTPAASDTVTSGRPMSSVAATAAAGLAVRGPIAEPDRLETPDNSTSPDNPIPTAAATGRLAGKVFVLTGTLPHLTRAQATAKIEAAGGRVAGAVSRATDYVVVGEDAGAKLARARALGIPLLDEPAFLSLLGEH